MVNMSDPHGEMDMSSPPHSPVSAIQSTANMQEMDMEQDDDDMSTPTPPPPPPPPSLSMSQSLLPSRGGPQPPMMISRIPASQSHMLPPPLPPGLSTPGLPPSIPSDRLPAPLKTQDVIIKQYNPKGMFLCVRTHRQCHVL
jgi:hypothetical protein